MTFNNSENLNPQGMHWPHWKTLRLWVICQPRSFRLLQEAAGFTHQMFTEHLLYARHSGYVFSVHLNILLMHTMVKARDAVERIRLPV